MSWSLAAFLSDTELQQLQHDNLLTTLPDAQAGYPSPSTWHSRSYTMSLSQHTGTRQ